MFQNSTIDLAFIPSTYQSNHIIHLQVSTSDHSSILLFVSLLPSSFLPHVKSSSRHIWLYSQADISKINYVLSSTPWDTLLSSDIDSSWSAFKARFLQVMHSCIPSKLCSHSNLPPWINRSLASFLMSSYRSQKLYLLLTEKKSKVSFFSISFMLFPLNFGPL